MQPERLSYDATPQATSGRHLRAQEGTRPRFHAHDVTRALLAAAELSKAARLVAIALASRANDAGQAWPQSARLAADCAMHRVSVRRAVRELVSAGLIEQSRATRGAFPNGAPAGAKDRITTWLVWTGAEVRARLTGASHTGADNQAPSPSAPPPESPEFVAKSPRMCPEFVAKCDTKPVPLLLVKTPVKILNCKKDLETSARTRPPAPRPSPPDVFLMNEQDLRAEAAAEKGARQALAEYRGPQSVYPAEWIALAKERMNEGATPQELAAALRESRRASWYADQPGRQTPGFVFGSATRCAGLAAAGIAREAKQAEREQAKARLSEGRSYLPRRETPKAQEGAFTPDFASIFEAIDRGRKKRTTVVE